MNMNMKVIWSDTFSVNGASYLKRKIIIGAFSIRLYLECDSDLLYEIKSIEVEKEITTHTPVSST